ncbi:MAG TPA: DNA repair protein RecN [Devosia sp.]|nr:DNA repair protein RecN [Devosia sp.]
MWVRNIVLIERLDLSFSGGLSVLTGETGAGKSILLDALTLCLGGRGDQSLVRAGCATGQVTAAFDLAADHGVHALLRDNGVDDGDQVILRRVQHGDGRTRAFINDQPVSVQLMREIGRRLVEIHGQHDERALVDVQTHRRLLDAFGGLEKKVRAVAQAHDRLVALEEELEAAVQRQAAAQAEEDFARFAVEELSRLAPEEGEEIALSDRRRDLMALEKAAGEIAEADDILNGPEGPSSVLSGLLRRLERKMEGESDLFHPLVEGIDHALVALQGTAEALQDIQREMGFDPEELNTTEERLFALRAASRKYKVPCDDLAGELVRFRSELAALESGDARLADLRCQREKALDAYRKLAADLSAARKESAVRLEKAIARELPDLKLGAARFLVDRQVDEKRVSAHGFDQIAFHVQTNPGTRAGPLLKVASGGELSRFLLALKVVLAEKGSAPVLIFDEIDTGVGGAVADAMGRRLARLSRLVQVLSVTHAPQVAARAQHHLLIEKAHAGGENAVRTRVHELNREQRGEEIARMLAGAEVSDEARAAARRLLSEVG